MLDIVFDSFTDSIKILPFLLLIYVFIEWVESDLNIRQKTTNLLKKKTAPLFGALFGVVPQCGFSIVSANLYLSGLIKIGTLMAVMIATSDEALPIFLTDKNSLEVVWLFLLIKVVYAFIVGFVVNVFDKSTPNLVVTTSSHHDGCCHHDVGKKKTLFDFLYHPIVHTAKVFLYVLAINLVFGFVVYFVGEENLSTFLMSIYVAQPLFATLVGLIPNCASSVLLANMFQQGMLTFSATMAGLCANSGLALAVIAKSKNVKQTAKIALIQSGASLRLGYLLFAFGI